MKTPVTPRVVAYVEMCCFLESVYSEGHRIANRMELRGATPADQAIRMFANRARELLDTFEEEVNALQGTG